MAYRGWDIRNFKTVITWHHVETIYLMWAFWIFLLFESVITADGIHLIRSFFFVQVIFSILPVYCDLFFLFNDIFASLLINKTHLVRIGPVVKKSRICSGCKILYFGYLNQTKRKFIYFLWYYSFKECLLGWSYFASYPLEDISAFIYWKFNQLMLMWKCQILGANSCSDLYRVVGEDFWLATWCNSAFEG